MPIPSAMVFVSDVASSLAFYETALGVPRHHLDDDGSYGELSFGDTCIGFVADWHASRHLGHQFRRHDRSDEPAGFELYFAVPEVDAAFTRAVEAGGVVIVPPADKPWGRTAILRDSDGVLFERASPAE